MKIKISPNGPELSQITFGVWRLLENADEGTPSFIQKKVEACLEHNITSFDHADIYGDYECEQAFGKFLKVYPHYKEKIQIVTKCGIALISKKRPEHNIKHYNYTAEHIRLSVENSLVNLNVESLDLVLFHRPSPMMDPDSVADIASKLTQEGKVKFWGVSNFTTAQFNMLSSRMCLHTNQVEANPYYIQPFLDGTLDQCIEKRISPMFWSPLAGGRLFKNQSGHQQKIFDVITAISKKYDQPIDAVAYSWLLQHPAKPVIVVGTNKLDRIKNAAFSLNIKWDLQDWFNLWQAAFQAEVP